MLVFALTVLSVLSGSSWHNLQLAGKATEPPGVYECLVAGARNGGVGLDFLGSLFSVLARSARLTLWWVDYATE